MDSTISNAQQVMGPAFQRPRVFMLINKSQSYTNWQHAFASSFVTVNTSPMDPECITEFNLLLKLIEDTTKSIAEHEVYIKSNKTKKDITDIIANLEALKIQLAASKAQQIAWQKEDNIVYAILQGSLGGAALLVAIPPVQHFVLNKIPTLRAAPTYQRLDREFKTPALHYWAHNL